jgi:hypothetical protein
MTWKSLEFEEGTEFGISKVLKKIEPIQGRSNFLCECSCGKQFECLGKKINRTLKKDRSGVKSCGCLNDICRSYRTISCEKDLAGRKIDKLLVLKRDFSKMGLDKHSSHYLCLCDCGNKKIVSRKRLMDKFRKSCGCLHEQVKREFLLNFANKNK